jgi:hypothetical protein
VPNGTSREVFDQNSKGSECSILVDEYTGITRSTVGNNEEPPDEPDRRLSGVERLEDHSLGKEAILFRQSRELDNIKEQDFKASLEKLEPFENPARSGKLMRSSDALHAKQLEKEEVPMAEKILEHRISRRGQGFIIPFYDLITYGSRPYIVMPNVTTGADEIYDLKGSEFMRDAPIMDNQFTKNHPKGLQIPKNHYVRWEEEFRRDLEFLSSQDVSDYSTLLVLKKGSGEGGVPATDPKARKEYTAEIFIIDLFQKYDLRRKVERSGACGLVWIVEAIYNWQFLGLHDVKQKISVASPQFYAKRLASHIFGKVLICKENVPRSS